MQAIASHLYKGMLVQSVAYACLHTLIYHLQDSKFVLTMTQKIAPCIPAVIMLVVLCSSVVPIIVAAAPHSLRETLLDQLNRVITNDLVLEKPIKDQNFNQWIQAEKSQISEKGVNAGITSDSAAILKLLNSLSRDTSTV